MRRSSLRKRDFAIVLLYFWGFYVIFIRASDSEKFQVDSRILIVEDLIWAWHNLIRVLFGIEKIGNQFSEELVFKIKEPKLTAKLKPRDLVVEHISENVELESKNEYRFGVFTHLAAAIWPLWAKTKTKLQNSEFSSLHHSYPPFYEYKSCILEV